MPSALRPKVAYFCARSNVSQRGLTFCKAVTFPPTPRTQADLALSLRVCSDVPTCKGRMSGWQCSAQTALPEGWPSIHASPSGALVGSVAPQAWPGLYQKQAKFKDIPPPLRAFDAQNRNARHCLRVAVLSTRLQLSCGTPPDYTPHLFS